MRPHRFPHQTASREDEGARAPGADGMTARQRAALALDLDGRSLAEVLGWAAECFGSRVALATGFGVEGCVLIDAIARHRVPIALFTLDTGLFFPETYALWRRLETRYGVTIEAVRPALDVTGQEERHGPRLWERDPDRCCELRKVVPLQAATAGLEAWMSAVRRDQTRARRVSRTVEWDGKFGLVKINPLAQWTAGDVWRYVRERDVPYNPLHDRGYPSIGCQPCTSAVEPGEDPRAGRWRGHGRTECGLHAAGGPRVIVLQPTTGDVVNADAD